MTGSEARETDLKLVEPDGQAGGHQLVQGNLEPTQVLGRSVSPIPKGKEVTAGLGFRGRALELTRKDDLSAEVGCAANSLQVVGD